MEPLSDEQLDRLLVLWVAPAAPRRLEQRVFVPKLPWWKRFFSTIGLRGPLPLNVLLNRRRFRRRKGTV